MKSCSNHLSACSIPGVTALFIAGSAHATALPPESVGRLIGHTDALPLSEQPFFRVPYALVRAVASGDEAQDDEVHILSSRFSWKPEFEQEGTVRLAFQWTHQWLGTGKEVLRLPLFPLQIPLETVSINGQPVTPVQEESLWVVYVPPAATVQVSGSIQLKPAFEQGWNQVALPLPRAAVRLVDVDLEAALEVIVSGQPGRVIPGDDGRTVGTLPVAGNGEIVLRWRPWEDVPPGPGTLRAGASGVLVVGEQELAVAAQLQVQVGGGERESVVLQLPGDAREVSLTGPSVREWRREGEGVIIWFAGALDGRAAFSVQYTRPIDVSKGLNWTPPRVTGAVDRGDGAWLVCRDAPGELLNEGATGFEEVTDLDVPKAILGMAPSAPVMALAQRARDPSLQLVRVATTPFPVADTLVDMADLELMVTREGAQMGKLTLTVRNNRRPYLALDLPEDAHVLSLRVEGEPRRWLAGDGNVLIPLEKSIQTLAGLISFPVEVVYAYQGDALTSSWQLDMPSLPEVPAAQWKTRLRLPEEWNLSDVQGGLRLQARPVEVVKDLRIGSAHVERVIDLEDQQIDLPRARQPKRTPRPIAKKSSATGDLGKNYWSLGYKSYKQGKVEDAKKYLENALDNDLRGAEAGQARQLLSNLSVATGEKDEKADRVQRLRAKSITRELQSDNNKLEAEQRFNLDEGLAALERGDLEKGSKLLSKVEQLGEQLGQRGDARRQVVIQTAYTGKLQQTREVLKKRKVSEKQLASSQSQVREALLDGEKGNQTFQRLAEAAEAKGVSLDAVTGYVLDGLMTNDGNGTVPILGDVPATGRLFNKGGAVNELSAIAEVVAEVVNAPKPVDQPYGGGGSGSSMFNDVTDLTGAVVNRAVPQSDTSKPQAQKPASRSSRMRDSDRFGVAREQLKSQLVGTVAQLKEESTRGLRKAGEVDARELARVRGRATKGRDLLQAYSNTFSDGTELAYDVVYNDLKRDLDETEKNLNRIEDERKNARQITVWSEVGGDAAKGESQKWYRSNASGVASFITRNYVPANTDAAPTEDGQGRAEAVPEGLFIQNGNFVASNVEGDGEVFGDALQQLVKNDGQVARFESVVLPGNLAQVNPFLSERLEANNGTAPIDAAEYQALLESNGRLNRDRVISQDSRDVVLGSFNKVSGQEIVFQGVDEDGDFSTNNWNVNGVTVQTSADQLFCVEIGGELHFIRSGQARNWQEEDKAPDWWALPDPKIDLPEGGREWLLTRALLGAGESPDVILALK